MNFMRKKMEGNNTLETHDSTRKTNQPTYTQIHKKKTKNKKKNKLATWDWQAAGHSYLWTQNKRIELGQNQTSDR